MSGKVVKFLGHYRNNNDNAKAEAIKKITDSTIKRSRLFHEYQSASFIGRRINAYSLIAPLLRYAMYGWRDVKATLQHSIVIKAQSDLDKYMNPPLKGLNKYAKIFGYYMRKLTKPTSQHYGYVYSILITGYIEPSYMLLGGSHLFRIAADLFRSVKLIFWSKVMENYAELLEKKDNSLYGALTTPILDWIELSVKLTSHVQ